MKVGDRVTAIAANYTRYLIGKTGTILLCHDATHDRKWLTWVVQFGPMRQHPDGLTTIFQENHLQISQDETLPEDI